jgi:hypothetical protein
LGIDFFDLRVEFGAVLTERLIACPVYSMLRGYLAAGATLVVVVVVWFVNKVERTYPAHRDLSFRTSELYAASASFFSEI